MSTTPPLRLRILMALTDVLKGITPADGFVADLSDFTDVETGDTKARVFRGRSIFGDDDPLPMLSILENPHSQDAEHTGPRADTALKGPWELMIQGWVQDDKENPTDPAHWLMADVKMALGQLKGQYQLPARQQNILGCGHAVDGIRIGAGVVRPPDEVSAKAYFWLTLTLEIVEDTAKPFA